MAGTFIERYRAVYDKRLKLVADKISKIDTLQNQIAEKFVDIFGDEEDIGKWGHVTRKLSRPSLQKIWVIQESKEILNDFKSLDSNRSDLVDEQRKFIDELIALIDELIALYSDTRFKEDLEKDERKEWNKFMRTLVDEIGNYNMMYRAKNYDHARTAWLRIYKLIRQYKVPWQKQGIEYLEKKALGTPQNLKAVVGK